MNLAMVLMMLVVVFVCESTAAQPVDPDPDGMGVYFDTEGMTWCLDVDDWVPMIGAGPTIPAYLLVTRPSTSLPNIHGWEAHVEIVTNSFTPPTGWTLTPGAVNTGKEGDYVVDVSGTASIPIMGDAVMLATIEIAWLGFEGHASAIISLRGVEGSQLHPGGPGYHSDDATAPVPCQCYFGSWGPVAWVNGDCNPVWPYRVVDESLTWGEVKSLY